MIYILKVCEFCNYAFFQRIRRLYQFLYQRITVLRGSSKGYNYHLLHSDNSCVVFFTE